MDSPSTRHTQRYSIVIVVFRVLITDADHPQTPGIGRLTAAGIDVRVAESTTHENLTLEARQADGLIVQWAKISDALLASAPKLRIVSRLGIGYDMIDVAAATRRGIAVSNTPTYCIDEVAVHTVGLALSLTRGIPLYDQSVRRGVWDATRPEPMAVRPNATTALVVGFGRIGSRVAAHLQALGFSVAVYDPFIDPAALAAHGFEPTALEDGLRRCDLVTLHVPLSAATRHMINRKSLQSIRPGSIVINTCRGGLIDEAALANALRSGHVAAAGLDVFEDEPVCADHELLQLPTVVATPHAAWYSPQSLVELSVQAADNVIRFLTEGHVDTVINPEHANHVQSAPH